MEKLQLEMQKLGQASEQEVAALQGQLKDLQDWQNSQLGRQAQKEAEQKAAEAQMRYSEEERRALRSKTRQLEEKVRIAARLKAAADKEAKEASEKYQAKLSEIQRHHAISLDE
jgi:hypothetical protein